MKRLGLFFLEAENGKADHYIDFFLMNIAKYLSKLDVVVSGELSKQSLDRLSASVKKAQFFSLGENAEQNKKTYAELETHLKGMDELVYFDASLFGPFYDLSDMLSTMSNCDADFYGITGIRKKVEKTNTVLADSCFLGLKNQVFLSEKFEGKLIEFLLTHNRTNLYISAVLVQNGFKQDVYAIDDMINQNTYDSMFTNARYLVEKKRCPALKKEIFYVDYAKVLESTAGQNAVEVFKYLKKQTDYPIDLIYEHIIRVGNMANIWRNLQLTYILPEDYVVKPNLGNKRVALMMHLYFEDKIKECYEYAKSMPEYADVYVTTDTLAKKAVIEEIFCQLRVNKIEVILIENRGRDVSALLVGCKSYIDQYDYICFVHDKKVTQYPASIGEGFAYKCLQNILVSPEFVENVINTFDNESRLGLLSPMFPNHGPYTGMLADSWSPNFEITVDFLESFDIQVPIDKRFQPIAPLGTMFWFRSEALKTLFSKNWLYSDFSEEPNGTNGTLLHAVERGYPFFAQHEGFYSGFVFCQTSSLIELSNLTQSFADHNNPAFTVMKSKYLLNLGRKTSLWIKIRDIILSLIIRKHRLFDEAYYLEQNSEVRGFKGTPLTHFIRFGVYDFRNPSPNVNVADFYYHRVKLYKKSKCFLFHYKKAD